MRGGAPARVRVPALPPAENAIVDAMTAPERLLRSPGASPAASPVVRPASGHVHDGHGHVGLGEGATPLQPPLQFVGVVEAMAAAAARAVFFDYGDTIIARDGWARLHARPVLVPGAWLPGVP